MVICIRAVFFIWFCGEEDKSNSMSSTCMDENMELEIIFFFKIFIFPVSKADHDIVQIE